MHAVTDELLMAHVDGELDAREAARVAAAIASDPALRQRAAEMRRLQQRVRAAFAGVLDEPVPSRLADTARGAAPADRAVGAAQVIAFPGRWASASWVRWGALAASVVLALGLWQLAGPGSSVAPDWIAEADGTLVAKGPLAAALDRRLSGDMPSDSVRLHVSFRALDGRACRAFSTEAVGGLACRDGSRWQLLVLAAPPARERGDMRLAGSSLPAAVIAAVERRIDGLAFDAAQEQAARDRGWAP